MEQIKQKKEVAVSVVFKRVIAGWAIAFAASAAVAQAMPNAAPQAPTPQASALPNAARVDPFPPVNIKNFTAETPSRELVDSFLKALWGYDPNRIWSVAAILKTPAPGVAKIVVYVADKVKGGKAQPTVFFTTPDGKHAIAGDVIDFGAKPFAEAREVLAARAVGAAEGAASKQLELVEFADLQCARCKDAQETMKSLAQDFPQAHIVFENVPIPELHPYAFVAAAEGVCVRKAKGDGAFFTYIQAVYDKQAALSGDSASAMAALSSAATAAGADPKSAAACATTQAAKDDVTASMQLATDLGVDSTPVLAVNGHLLPLAGIQYETLKNIIAFQAGQDGLVVHVQPTLTTLH
jgi:protein-disulfide isomerase